MKKWISIILMLLLLLSSALAAKGDANLGREIYKDAREDIVGGFLLGDRLYVYGYHSIYAWRDGDADLAPLTFEMPTHAQNEDWLLTYMFSADDRAYALIGVYGNEAGSAGLVRTELRELLLSQDALCLGEPRPFDGDALIASFQDIDYLMQIDGCAYIDNILYLLVRDGSAPSPIYAFNLTSGKGGFLDVDSAEYICAYKDSTLLLESWDANRQELCFRIFDPADESLTDACAPIRSQTPYRGLCYSVERDALFFLAGGYVKAAQSFDFEAAQTVAELSQATDVGAAMLMSGDKYVFASPEGVFVRGTDPGALPGTYLKIAGNPACAAIVEAYYDFTPAHADVGVVIAQEPIEDAAIISAMLNRDADTDIYVTRVGSQAYAALMARGYLLELTAPDLRAAIAESYPGIRAALTREGAPVALPLLFQASMLGVNRACMERLGISESTLPRSWLAFFDFLERAMELLPTDGSARILDAWYSQDGLRRELVAEILECYRNEVEAEGEIADYSSPVLRETLLRALDFDYAALGLPEDIDEMQLMFLESSSDTPQDAVLLEISMGAALGSFYRINNSTLPLPLALSPDREALLPMELYVAFINPHSQSMALAQEYMLEIYRNLDTATRYNMCADMNEPVRSDAHAQVREEILKRIEDARERLADSSELDRAMIEDEISSLENDLAFNDEVMWRIAPDALKWYREHARNIYAVRCNPLMQYGAGDMDVALEQLLQGQLDVDTFLKRLGARAQMIALEG